MTQMPPRTLLQMAGAPLSPSPFSEAAIVLIDCQNEYLDGALPLPGAEDALVEISRLVARARLAKSPVLHIAHKGRAGGAFDPAGPGFGFALEASPQAGEPVITKDLPNSFAGTDLQAYLAGTNRRQLILAGFMTHMCVSSTARAALDLGYRVTVVAAATATRALPDPLGGPALGADEVQRAALAALADRFAIIAPGVDDLA